MNYQTSETLTPIYQGLTETEAKTKAEERDEHFRSLIEDGRHNVITMDLRGNRVNAEFEKGKVKQVMAWQDPGNGKWQDYF